jgi:YggT family protein
VIARGNSPTNSVRPEQGDGMSAPFIFIAETLFELYILCFMLRFVLQAGRADFHNPLSQFIVRVTNPLIVPLRRVVPGLRGLDMATVVLVLLLEILATAVLIPLKTGVNPSIAMLLYFSLLRTVVSVLRLYVFAILIYAILSFVNPGSYNPLSSVLTSICEPVLRPFRRVIPPIGGLDLSPLFLIIILQALIMAIPLPGVLR